MSKISERFSEVVKKKGISNAFLSKKHNISRQLVNNFLTNQKTLTDKFAEVCDKENININWLLTGKGEMFLNEQVDTPTSKNNYQIDVLNVKASAGFGIENELVEVVDTILLDKSLFKTPINQSKVKLVEVVGDSMFPTIKDGDFVIIDETKTHGVDGIYAINLHNQLLIKRLKFKIDGTIAIISDNKDYETEIYNPNETQIPLQIIGLRILTIQR